MAFPLLIGGALGGVAATIGKFIVGYAIVRVIAALGIGLITFSALDVFGNQVESFIVNNTSGIGGQFWDVAVALNVPHAIKIVTSAYMAAIAIKQIMGIFNRVTFGKS